MRTFMHGVIALLWFTSNHGTANEQTNSFQVEYQSVFEHHLKWQAIEQTRDWIGANENVKQIGGWKYYASEPNKIKNKDEKQAKEETDHNSIPIKGPKNDHQHHSGGQQ